jgi:hypothetical protein
VTYPRLERGGITVPAYQFNETGTPILGADGDSSLRLTFVGAAD